MTFKYLCLFALTLALVAAEPKKVSKKVTAVDDRVPAGFYIKDNDNGELRFLTGTGSSGGVNSALNQYITQKQDMLEQLRPTSANTGTLTGTGSVTGTGTGTGAIIISGGGGGSTGVSGGLPAAAIGASPIADLLPQIAAQGVLGGGNLRRRGNTNVRRRGNKRRRGGNNRRRRRPNNKKGNKGGVYVIRG